jgi:hypothetical protein
MEPEGSLLHTQVPDTCLYPEPAQSTSYLLKIHLNIILLLHLDLLSGLFPPGFPTKTLNMPLPSPANTGLHLAPHIPNVQSYLRNKIVHWLGN